MSADLFAEFGNFSQSQNAQQPQQQQQQPPKTTTPAPDPFSFLSPAPAPSTIQTQTTQTRSQPPAPVAPSQPWSFSLQPQPASIQPAAASPWAGFGATTANTTQAGDEEGEDAWGDFEVAAPTGPSQSQSQSQSQSRAVEPVRPPASMTSAQPPQRPTRLRAPTLDLMTNNLVDLGASGPPGTRIETVPERPSWEKPAVRSPEPPKPPRAKNADPNVLFDADDFDPDSVVVGVDVEDEEDDFGDFETVTAPPPMSTKPPATAVSAVDLLAGIWPPAPAATPAATPAPVPARAPAAVVPPKPASSTRKQPPSQLLSTLSLADTTGLYPQAPKSPSFQQRNPFPGLALTTPKSAEFPKEDTFRGNDKGKPPSPSPVTAWPSVEPQPKREATAGKKASGGDDDWGAFEDFPSEGDGDGSTTAGETLSPGWDWDAVDAVAPKPKAAAPPRAPLKKTKEAAPARPAAKPSSSSSSSQWDWDAVDAPAPAPAPPVQTTVTTSPPAPRGPSVPIPIPTPPLPTSALSPSPATTIPDDAPPPTNIPPPSVLLSLFPPLFALPEEALFRPLAAHPAAARARALADPRAADFLRGFLLLAVVAARVVAGRKLRWHRDRFLAQGMAIAEVSSSGKTARGMKLAGLDRAQGAREDREAADVVAAWRACVGKLRGAVAAANSSASSPSESKSSSPPLKIPTLSETMAVQPAAQGTALSAPRPCLVCGLRRDERVRGVDDAPGDVEDSFGEWWVDHWGHRSCRNFWVRHEAALRSR